MGSPEYNVDDLERQLLAHPSETSWATADDVARLSLESLLEDQRLVRTMPSRGVLRFSGEGVKQSTAPLPDVIRALRHFQRLTTAIAAADEGDIKLGKQPSAAVDRNTRLLVSGSPGQGSLVFELAPEMPPTREVSSLDGPLPLFVSEGQYDQQIDKAIDSAIELMDEGSRVPIDPAGSEFLSRLSTLGPRAASSVRDFAKALAGASFDADVEWRQPNRPTRRVHLTSSKAELIAQVIETAELDIDEVDIEGVVLTVSTVQKQAWLIERGVDDLVSVRHGQLPPSQTLGIATGERIRIHAQMRTTVSNTGVTRTVYEAQGIERIPDEDQ